MKNLGKQFEENWKKSVPDYMFYYRFRDSSGTWGGNEQLRFTPSNIADCLIQDPFTGLHLIELKNHKGKSIPLSCIIGTRKNDKPTTKEKQINDLLIADGYSSVFSSLIVFFCDVERCFELSINSFLDFVNKGERMSIPIEYFEKHGTEIKVTKIRTSYRFDIESWMREF